MKTKSEKDKSKELNPAEFAKSNNLGRVLIGLGLFALLMYLVFR